MATEPKISIEGISADIDLVAGADPVMDAIRDLADALHSNNSAKLETAQNELTELAIDGHDITDIAENLFSIPGDNVAENNKILELIKNCAGGHFAGIETAGNNGVGGQSAKDEKEANKQAAMTRALNAIAISASLQTDIEDFSQKNQGSLLAYFKGDHNKILKMTDEEYLIWLRENDPKSLKELTEKRMEEAPGTSYEKAEFDVAREALAVAQETARASLEIRNDVGAAFANQTVLQLQMDSARTNQEDLTALLAEANSEDLQETLIKAVEATADLRESEDALKAALETPGLEVRDPQLAGQLRSQLTEISELIEQQDHIISIQNGMINFFENEDVANMSYGQIVNASLKPEYETTMASFDKLYGANWHETFAKAAEKHGLSSDEITKYEGIMKASHELRGLRREFDAPCTPVMRSEDIGLPEGSYIFQSFEGHYVMGSTTDMTEFTEIPTDKIQEIKNIEAEGPQRVGTAEEAGKYGVASLTLLEERLKTAYAEKETLESLDQGDGTIRAATEIASETVTNLEEKTGISAPELKFNELQASLDANSGRIQALFADGSTMSEEAFMQWAKENGISVSPDQTTRFVDMVRNKLEQSGISVNPITPREMTPEIENPEPIAVAGYNPGIKLSKNIFPNAAIGAPDNNNNTAPAPTQDMELKTAPQQTTAV